MKFSGNFLEGTSTRHERGECVDLGHFDIAIVSPSWDRRSECVMNARFTAANGIAFRFTTEDSEGLQAIHESRIIAALKSRCSLVHEIVGDAICTDEMWSSLWSCIGGIAQCIGRSLRVLIDITTCPRFLSLSAIAALFKTGLGYEVIAFYAEGRYSESGVTSSIDYPFSVGHWKSIPIPFLLGLIEPAKQKHYIVSVGFEGVRTARALEKADPDRVSVLMPIPGVARRYSAETVNRNQEVIDRYCIPKRQVVSAHAADAIGAWKKLAEAKLEEPGDEEVSYLLCGTKPHSLGMALRALTVGYPTVLYNRPEVHNFVDIESNGITWTYKIADLSSLPV